MIDGLDRFWRARSWSDIKKMTPENQAKILPYIYQWTETAEGLSGEEAYLGFAQMDAMRNAALAASKDFDFIISPTAPMPTYRRNGPLRSMIRNARSSILPSPLR